MSGLLVRGLVLRYAGASTPAVRGLEFHVPTGSLTALLGPSGCGKSSVLRAVAGLLQPEAGQVSINGRDLGALPPEQRRVALVFQSPSLFPHLSVLENARFALDAAGVAPAQADERARTALAAVGLLEEAARRPRMLSGGEQQRVALARALAQQPAVLLLDEPMSNVEPRRRRALREEIRALQSRLGLTVVYVTHDHHEAMAVADQIVLMNEGQMVQAGTPQALYEQPASSFAAAFMGEATVVAGRRDLEGFIWVGPLRMPTLHPGKPGHVRVAIRPEAWQLQPCSQPGLPGKVLSRHYLGRLMEYMVRTQVGDVLVHVYMHEVCLDCGAPVSLDFAPRGVCVLQA